MGVHVVSGYVCPIPTAAAVCQVYWNPPKTRCVGCPIERECSAPTIPLTRASLDTYQVRLEAAAKLVPLGGGGS